MNGAWNLDVVAEVLFPECTKMNWVTVVRCFDHPRVVIKTEQTFECLVKLVYKVSGQPLNVEGLFGNWGNKLEQLHLLSLAANTSSRAVDFSVAINRALRLEGNFLLIYIRNFHVLHDFLLIYVRKLQGNRQFQLQVARTGPVTTSTRPTLSRIF